MKALITGASSGIGKSFAKKLSSMGYDLIITARRKDRLENLKQEIKNVDVKIIEADLSKREECFRLYNEVKNEDIDVLINNAGFGACGYFDELDILEDLSMIDVNIVALHILTKLFLQNFMKKNKGYILNVASSAAFFPGPLMAEYYATKAFVLRLTQAIYEELRRKKSNIKISALCPGPVDTEFNSVAKVKFALKGLKPDDVASYSIDKMFKGKTVIVPGFAMKCGTFFSKFIGYKFMLKIAFHIQQSKIK